MEPDNIIRKSSEESLYDHRIIYPRELPWILRRHIYTGAMGTIYYWAIGTVFIAQFVRSIGMSDSGWAYLNGCALMVHSLQMVSAHITEKVGKRKLIWFVNAFFARLSVLE